MITDKVGGSSAKPEVSKQSKEKRLKHKVSGYKSQSKRRSIAGCHLLLRTLCLCFLSQRLDFVDFATGSLGQGLSCACGMAYTGKYFDKARWNFILFHMIWHLFFWYMNYSFGIFWSKLKGLLWVTGQVPSFLYICWVKVVIIYLFIFYLFGRKKHIYIQTSVYIYKNVRLKD